MRPASRHYLGRRFVGLVLLAAAAGSRAEAGNTDFARKLADYNQARQQYEEKASAYWNSIAQKRQLRNSKRRNRQEILIDDYVLTQPPIYSGPPRPIDPSVPREQQPPSEKAYVPVVADFLKAAADEFDFVPQRPHSELDYKRAYAKVATAAGLTREQIVRIYGFECGGNGNYDLQAGLEYSASARAINTALGYNQLLNTNSVELMAEKGDQFIETLRIRAAGLTGEPARSLDSKIEVVRRMVRFSRTVADDWNEHDRIANTAKGLGVHAMNLDIDVGPLLQTQKLLDSLQYARRKGYGAALTAAELEMMNLTGDANGLDMVMMPAAMREQVPTSNFFQRGGYGRNPVASRNNVVSKLIAATNGTMDKEEKMRGARELAAAF